MRSLSVKKRREKIVKETKAKLKSIGQSKDGDFSGNCENVIGTTQVPLGIAGPISLSLQKTRLENVYLPLATTEGALVASVNRGAKVAQKLNGLKVLVKKVGTTRAPVFKTRNLKQSLDLVNWTEKNFLKIKKQAEKTSSHLKLLKIEPFFLAKSVWLRFFYDTDEAMGMNMVTIATQKAVAMIESKFKVECVSLSGNMCVDKKPAWLNLVSGKGYQAWVEARIKKSMVEKILKTSSKKIAQVVLKKDLYGSALSGSMGFNGHFANIVAAMFLATGQDIAHVVEGSMGVVEAQVEKNGDLYFSVFLPSLMLGTVGGGTGLPTQKEALEIISLKGQPGDAEKLAALVASGVWCGELSLTATLASGSLACAHQQLGRRKND